MIKRDELSIGTSCLSRASHDEPLFVLRANDAHAAQAVREWAEHYRFWKISQDSYNERELHKYEEALRIADQMEAWRRKNLP